MIAGDELAGGRAMKNVIVFALEGERYAVELRWVREVFTLGFVTPVPSAPAAFAGLVNLRGAITPVLTLPELLSEAPEATSSARQGDAAVLLEVEGAAAALRITAVDEVSTLRQADDGADLLDSRGRRVPMLDPPALFERAQAATDALRALPPPTPERDRG
jgi:chemotaxis signal transduction protein